MLRGGRVLVARSDGAPKVVLTSDGLIVKRISPEPCGGVLDRTPRALRFVRHAHRLAALGVPVPDVLAVHRVEGVRDHVLVYRPVAGRTVREAASDAEDPAALSAAFARSLARLHDLGVVFRAGHLGNYVLCDDGSLGLIDVHALSIVGGPVSVVRRARSFRILLKDPRDRALVSAAGGLRGFLRHYGSATRLGAARLALLTALVRALHPAARRGWRGAT